MRQRAQQFTQCSQIFLLLHHTNNYWSLAWPDLCLLNKEAPNPEHNFEHNFEPTGNHHIYTFKPSDAGYYCCPFFSFQSSYQNVYLDKFCNNVCFSKILREMTCMSNCQSANQTVPGKTFFHHTVTRVLFLHDKY